MHEPGDLCHLRQVLVLLREAVLAGGIERRRAALGLIIGDHALAAAGIAGEGVAGEQRVRRQGPRLYQRLHQGYEAAGVAAGTGHAPAVYHRLAVLRRELREAVRPAGGDAVGGGGVHHAHVGGLDHGHGLAAGLVWQAEDGDVAAVEGLAARRRVPSRLAAEREELDIRALGEA